MNVRIVSFAVAGFAAVAMACNSGAETANEGASTSQGVGFEDYVPSLDLVCDNVVRLMGEAGFEMAQADCVEQLVESEAECDGDYNASLRCLHTAPNIDEIGLCGAHCGRE